MITVELSSRHFPAPTFQSNGRYNVQTTKSFEINLTIKHFTRLEHPIVKQYTLDTCSN